MCRTQGWGGDQGVTRENKKTQSLHSQSLPVVEGTHLKEQQRAEVGTR